MRSIGLIAVCWLSLSVFDFGVMNADLKYHSQNDWQGLHLHRRDHLGILVGESVIAPLGFVVAMLATNFMQHGWTLENW
jgi:hypothetical protein